MPFKLSEYCPFPEQLRPFCHVKCPKCGADFSEFPENIQIVGLERPVSDKVYGAPDTFSGRPDTFSGRPDEIERQNPMPFRDKSYLLKPQRRYLGPQTVASILLLTMLVILIVIFLVLAFKH